MPKTDKPAETVTLFRIPDTYTTWMDAPDGDEIEVSRDEADRLLAFSPPAFSTFRAEATGGLVTPGAAVLVGERGPETIVPSTPAP